MRVNLAEEYICTASLKQDYQGKNRGMFIDSRVAKQQSARSITGRSEVRTLVMPQPPPVACPRREEEVGVGDSV